MSVPAPVKGYQCDRCRLVSVGPEDVQDQYCGHCHVRGTGVIVVANWDDPWLPDTHPVLIPPRWGCSTISHARLGWCAGCPKVDQAAELLAWRLHALDATVPGYRGAIRFCAQGARS